MQVIVVLTPAWGIGKDALTKLVKSVALRFPEHKLTEISGGDPYTFGAGPDDVCVVFKRYPEDMAATLKEHDKLLKVVAISSPNQNADHLLAKARELVWGNIEIISKKDNDANITNEEAEAIVQSVIPLVVRSPAVSRAPTSVGGAASLSRTSSTSSGSTTPPSSLTVADAEEDGKAAALEEKKARIAQSAAIRKAKTAVDAKSEDIEALKIELEEAQGELEKAAKKAATSEASKRVHAGLLDVVAEVRNNIAKAEAELQQLEAVLAQVRAGTAVAVATVVRHAPPPVSSSVVNSSAPPTTASTVKRTSLEEPALLITAANVLQQALLPANKKDKGFLKKYKAELIANPLYNEALRQVVIGTPPDFKVSLLNYDVKELKPLAEQAQKRISAYEAELKSLNEQILAADNAHKAIVASSDKANATVALLKKFMKDTLEGAEKDKYDAKVFQICVTDGEQTITQDHRPAWDSAADQAKEKKNDLERTRESFVKKNEKKYDQDRATLVEITQKMQTIDDLRKRLEKSDSVYADLEAVAPFHADFDKRLKQLLEQDALDYVELKSTGAVDPTVTINVSGWGSTNLKFSKPAAATPGVLGGLFGSSSKAPDASKTAASTPPQSTGGVDFEAVDVSGTSPRNSASRPE